MNQPSFRVLYIEDAFDQALLVKAMLNTMSGYQVTHVQDGDQALTLLKNEHWDLIITDLNVPGADGFAVIRTARKHSVDTPILVTTGYEQAQYEEQALRAGADQVIIKPLNRDEFVTRVVGMVERDQRSSADLDLDEIVVVIEGRLGDAEMGCGGVLMKSVAEHEVVVVVPVLNDPEAATHEELKAASLAADILGIERRMDRALFGDRDAQRDLIEQTLHELRPTTVYLPAPNDRDVSRREASLMGVEATSDIPTYTHTRPRRPALSSSPNASWTSGSRWS
ncbi:MAG: response regulator [Gemmatimonadota bacterium]|nr:response regulator [Gemmatimonadota bacterium]MDE3006270.1 response regulator [Gemmatimonadota bacterium]MDE3014025.1 response regulator [Gemmatimonadota bacterium]